MKLKLNLSILLLMLAMVVQAQQIPESRLFYFERSTNDNIVCYDVNQKDGKLDVKKPMEIYWTKLDSPHLRGADINFLDRTAFGIKRKKISTSELVFEIKASSKKTFTLCRRQGKWMAVTQIAGHEAQVVRMYVKMKSALSAEYLDIFGKDLATGQNLRERLKN